MDIKDNRQTRKAKEKIVKKDTKESLKGKSKYEKQMITLISAEIQVISFLMNKDSDKGREEIFKEGIKFQHKKEIPSLLHNLVALLNKPIKNTETIIKK